MFRTDEAMKCTHDKDANKLGLVGVLANAPTGYYSTACHCYWSRLKARRVGEMGGEDVATNKIVEDMEKCPTGFIYGAPDSKHAGGRLRSGPGVLAIIGAPLFCPWTFHPATQYF